jgi:xylulokinase
MKLLGIDVGTSGTRAVVIDETGRITATATGEHAAFASPQAGWAEQDARDWWRASVEAVRAVLASGAASADDIRCIGLSGQMHGATLLDAGGEVLRPSIIWCDVRTGEQCRALTEQIGAARLIELVLNPALENFTLPKMLWVREREPRIWERVRTVLLPKDYVRLRLTGERATDVTDASGTLLFAVGERAWSNEILARTGIEQSVLPAVFESSEVCGRISAAGAAATGLRAGTPVVAGAGDQAAGAVGLGVVRPGSVSATIGTSGVVFAATDRPALDRQGRVHTFCHAVPGRWHVMGVTQAAGLSLRWFRDRFGAGATGDAAVAAGGAASGGAASRETGGGRDPYELLSEEAAAAPPGADGLVWTPYLMGERTPHLDPQARAALVGLTMSHTRAHVVRAILEGVAFSLRDTLTIFAEMNVPVRGIKLGGGGARSALWRQIQADVYGQAIELVEAEEGAAYGAALLAGVGGGAWSTVDEACEATVRVRARLEPDTARARLMDERYRVYRAVYPALRDVL